MSNLVNLAQQAEEEFDLSDFALCVRKARSTRRFVEDDPIPEALLIELVNLARLVPSGRNDMSLRYRVVSKAAERAQLFEQLHWAGALKDWAGPAEGERPTGYIVICDTGTGATTPTDEGIAAQTIFLAACEAGYGACMLHAFNKAQVSEIFNLEAKGVVPLMVIALGTPGESIALEELSDSANDTNYWRDENSIHHVPKRKLEDILL